MYAYALPQVDVSARGIHLIWVGPTPWLYSPHGWDIQRRVAREHPERMCDGLSQDQLDQIRQVREARLDFGWLTLTDGEWPLPVALASGPSQSPTCEIFTLQLDQPKEQVVVQVRARESFVLAFRDGKVVATGGDPVVGDRSYDLRAPLIDAVAVYTQHVYDLEFCVEAVLEDPDRVWADEPYLVRGLQIPLKELMPGLAGPAQELAEARSRLLPGESLDAGEFVDRVAALLRPAISQTRPPRPIDQVLLVRESLAERFEELVGLDPIRLLIWHPAWRRALGFGWFDDDPELTEGDKYQYRITGYFPVQDLVDRVYGFHTIPSKTALPAEFYLGDLRLRWSHPVTVELRPGTGTGGLLQLSRRGIRIPEESEPHWILAFLEDWHLVVDFPTPVTRVILEVHGHQLEYQALQSAALPNVVDHDMVPAGAEPQISFPMPIQQLRLRGSGFLFAIRVPAGPSGVEPRSIVLPPVTYQDTPRPAPPISMSIANLQQPPPPIPATDVPSGIMPPRHQLGFQVRWRPALQGGLTYWPTAQAGAAPLEATIFQVEQRQLPSTVWRPVLSEDNLMLGNREQNAPNTAVFPGVDLLQLYPESRPATPGVGLDLTWMDTFEPEEVRSALVESFALLGEARNVPPPGTEHQYRVRAVDPVGRPSFTWTESNVLRLEKHVPPPQPVSPSETPADQFPLPAPTGVQTRVLVRGAPDLTTADQALLGTADNAIVLRWGWHGQQRYQDPLAREFRVYFAARPLDAVDGTLTSVTTVMPGRYQVTLQLERAILADAATRTYLHAGYPFFITAHTAGATITASIEARVPQGGVLPVPAQGPIRLALRLTPTLTRPAAWTARVEVQSIGPQQQYQAILRDRLTATPSHPRDAVWVGVSAADDQPYVQDQLAPLENRPGNESAIVALRCEATYHGRPAFHVPPPLELVPVLVAPEPGGRPLVFSLNLAASPVYLDGTGLSAGTLVRPERVAAESVFGAYRVTPDGRIMARVLDPRTSGDTDQELLHVAEQGNPENPADRASVIAALRSGRPDRLADHYVVFLAGVHAYRDRLFTRCQEDPLPLGPFQETLPPRGGRYVYRFRLADAAGNVSAGSALARVIVRVPSLTPSAAPERLMAESSDPSGTLRLRVVEDAEITHVLAFAQPASNGSGPVEVAELLRVPNRADLYPAPFNPSGNGLAGLWLRAPDGALLDPSLIKSLADADVTMGSDGPRRFSLTFSGSPGGRVRVWSCTLTRDGIPSLLGGPWSIAFPRPPVAQPVLSVSGGASTPVFNWTWPSPPEADWTIHLERSEDGESWRRCSLTLDAAQHTGYPASGSYLPPPGNWRYRLVVRAVDGREATSNEVEP